MYTKEELESKTVDELRKIAPKVGVKNCRKLKKGNHSGRKRNTFSKLFFGEFIGNCRYDIGKPGKNVCRQTNR